MCQLALSFSYVSYVLDAIFVSSTQCLAAAENKIMLNVAQRWSSKNHVHFFKIKNSFVLSIAQEHHRSKFGARTWHVALLKIIYSRGNNSSL
jgi:hypothetical protein